jgi:hypothetical protein
VAAPQAIRDPRLAAALSDAIAGGPRARLVDLLERASNLPGKPNLNLARAAGERLASAGAEGRALAGDLVAEGVAEKRVTALFLAHVGLMGLALSAAGLKGGAGTALDEVHDTAGDERHEVRDAATAALAAFLERAGDPGLDAITGFFDGYLHAHVALEALARREVLDRLKRGEVLVARLDEAFALADAAPRAADRSQGLRTLRAGFAAEIAAFAARFEHEVLTWLEGWLDRAEHPESRAALDATLAALRRKHQAEAVVDRLRGRLAASAPPPRDPARIVAGTRKRSRGRR